MNATVVAALIVAGGAFLGAFVGNATSGLLSRWTQRDQQRAAQLAASQADRRALRDGHAGRLREAYGRVIEATFTWSRDPTDEGEKELKHALLLAQAAVGLEPGGEQIAERFGTLYVAVRDGKSPEPLVQAVADLIVAARRHIDQFQEPIPPPPA